MFTVRPAEPDDAEAICAVAREAWHAAYDDVVGAAAVDEAVDEWYDPAQMREQATQAQHFYVAVTVDEEAMADVSERGLQSVEDVERAESGFEDELVGYASGGVPDEAPEEGVVGALYVRPDHWGEGVGSKLLGSLAVDFASLAAERVVAVVIAENDLARDFFDGLGFAERGRLPSELGGVETESIELVADLGDVSDAVESREADVVPLHFETPGASERPDAEE